MLFLRVTRHPVKLVYFFFRGGGVLVQIKSDPFRVVSVCSLSEVLL